MNKARRKELETLTSLLNDIQAKLEEARELARRVAEDEREYYDNMPEGLQNSEKGEQADTAASALEDVAQELENFDLDNLVSQIETASE